MVSYLGIDIDYTRDSLLPEKGLEMLTREGFYKKPNEDSPQESFARAATAYCFGDYSLAQRVYDGVSKGWAMYSSPVLSNAEVISWPDFGKDGFDKAAEWLEQNVKTDCLPISCFLSKIPDTRKGLVDTRAEVSWLSMNGGGVGVYASNRSPDEKSTGVMAHLAGYDKDTLAYRQTEKRRGSIAAYLDINHPEIKSFIQMRNPVGGDTNKKCFNLNNAINITDDFMQAVAKGEDYELIDPKHGATGKFLNAREVWEEILDMRFQTGEPYLNFIDTINRTKPSWIKNPLYKISQSNLCNEIHLMTSDKRTAVCCLSSLNLDKYDEWKDTGFVEDMIRFLDNVLEYFIRLADKVALKRAIYSAKKERALGLGTFGYHSYFKRNNIAFESSAAASATYKMFSNIKSKAVASSLQLARERGECDDVRGSGMRNSHLCVSGDTKILTKQGQKDIKTLVGKDIEIWNGEEWSKTKPFETGVSRLLKVCFSNGMELKCTPDHRFLIATPKRDTSELGGLKLIEVEADKLRVGDCLPKFFTSPNECELELEYPYESGLFCGDGSISNSKAGKYPRKELRLYGDKMALAKDIKWKSNTTWGGDDCVRGYLPDACLEKYTVPFGYSITSKTLWLCGLIDADGYSGSKGVSISTASKDFAKDVALLVQELGGDVNVTEVHRKGGFNSANATYWVVGISMHSCNKLFKTITPKRVKVSVSGATHQKIGSYHMTEVVSVEYLQEQEMTYCFTEKKRGTGIFNGILTKQCAIAPNANSADILGVSPSIEPSAGNCYNSQGRAGSFLIKDTHLEALLETKGKNTPDVWKQILEDNGSVHNLDFLSEHEKNVYKAGKQINPQWIIEHAALRQEFVCQGQSLNIQVYNNITKQEMSDIHWLAWKKGVKGLYYCRTESVGKVNVGTGGAAPLNSIPVKFKIDIEECLSCQG